MSSHLLASGYHETALRAKEMFDPKCPPDQIVEKFRNNSAGVLKFLKDVVPEHPVSCGLQLLTEGPLPDWSVDSLLKGLRFLESSKYLSDIPSVNASNAFLIEVQEAYDVLKSRVELVNGEMHETLEVYLQDNDFAKVLRKL